MALFKIFKGPEDELSKVPVTEGYAYVTKDKGNFYVDIAADKRIQINAGSAAKLEDGETVLGVNDILTNINNATTQAYTATLNVNDWVESENMFYQDWANTELICGKDHNVPPTITYTSNKEEYIELDPDKTNATPQEGIRFWTSKKPTNPIDLIVIDNK